MGNDTKKIPFDSFWNSLSETNTTLDAFVDFEKVSRNTERLNIRLSQLNYLLGQKNLAKATAALFRENPKAFDIAVFEILIAVRDGKNKKVLDKNLRPRRLDEYFDSAESVMEFMEQTGLGDVFRDRKITNLKDYVFGVEVGLDSNARKSRGGSRMAKEIARRFARERIPFRTEVESAEFSDIRTLGVDRKRFDFVVKTRRKTYLIEVNFYNTSGSKPNEVARAYSELSEKLSAYPKYEFVWITDGNGWIPSKNKIQEAYRTIPNIFNLRTFETFIARLKTEGFENETSART